MSHLVGEGTAEPYHLTHSMENGTAEPHHMTQPVEDGTTELCPESKPVKYMYRSDPNRIIQPMEELYEKQNMR